MSGTVEPKSNVPTFFQHTSMGDLKALIKAKLLRRHSTSPSVASSKNSTKSGRPTSKRSTNYAASSVHTSNEVGEDGDHKGEIINVELEPKISNTHLQSSGYPGGSSFGHSSPSSIKMGAGKSRPSTGVSGPPRDIDHKEASRTTAISPGETESIETNTFTPESNNNNEYDQSQEMASTAEQEGSPDSGAPEVAGRRGETLASANVNSSTTSNLISKKTTDESSTLGSDQQYIPGLTNANTSSASALPSPAINNTSLPSINEHPATPDNAIESHIIDSAADKAIAATLLKPAISLNPTSEPASETTTSSAHAHQYSDLASSDRTDAAGIDVATPVSPSVQPSPAASRPGVTRRQSLIPNRQQALIRTLLDSGQVHDIDPDQLLPISGNMVTRKIWVKRPGASATMVTINEDDLVDDVRDMILRKYANSLGRQFDSPDLTIRIVGREQNPRYLQPDEPMGRTIDAYFPGGQTVDDALLIDVPTRRTPKASPNPRYYSDDVNRPHESGTEYFPPYPPAVQAHAALATTGGALHIPPSMAILNNGQLPPLPSPGSSSSRRMAARPKMQRLHTASPISTATSHVPHTQHAPVPVPTSIGTHTYTSRPQRSRTHSGASSDQTNHSAHPHPHPPPIAPPMPTPPAPDRVATPPPVPRVASPRPSTRPKKKKTMEPPALPPGMLNGSVPPINVLIVEDNIINLKLLEAFVKRLKVRWQTAMNGRDAVTKWRSGGFHLVLMDIQLPIMNGLDATREIRRIEKVNSIGVFSSSASRAPDEVQGEPDEKDKLPNTEMFKSPVIIVALTASSLQSDRHEALAAGCNDFLTKPVNFVWLERKVMEWGCMQALIDFDGWRKWKDFSQKAAEDDSAKKAAAAKAKAKKRQSLSGAAIATVAA